MKQSIIQVSIVLGLLCMLLCQVRAPPPAVTCPLGQYYDTSTTVCTKCPVGCTDCTDSTNCVACELGLSPKKYTGNKWLCECNNIAQFYDSNSKVCGSCSTAIDHCIQCISNINGVKCNKCEDMYYLNTSTLCLPCPTYCATCQNSTKCQSCITYYVISNSLCVPDKCSNIITGCLTCTISPLACSQCMERYFLSGTTCTACGTNCLTCDAMGCLTCVSAGFTVVNGDCVACNLAIPNTGCTTCSSATQCLTCTRGYSLNPTTSLCELICASNQALIASTCQLCSSAYTAQCLTCDPLVCLTCETGYAYNSGTKLCDLIPIVCQVNEVFVGGVCQLCSVLYDPRCGTCDTAVCITCTVGYEYNSTSKVCQTPLPVCNQYEALISQACQPCKTLYDPLCTQCTPTVCTTCQLSYTYNLASTKCEPQPSSTAICGDGNWSYPTQPCDDANLTPNDGCDALCQIEPDYTCLISDRLLTGASLCKYTKEITTTLNYIEKEISSNTAHLFFTIEPETFNQWTTEQIQKYLSPVEIVDQETGEARVIPCEGIGFVFRREGGVNRLEVVVGYGEESVEDTFLRFNPNPSQTSLTGINSQPTPKPAYTKISSQFNGVDLYSYSQESYELQRVIEWFCMVLGYVALGFMLVGWVVPVGKLVVVEAVAVVQVVYVSVLQFDKIPATYVGFRGLIISNGYNSPQLFRSPTPQTTNQAVYKLMGLNQTLLSNYNLSFLMLLIPLTIGLIGFGLTKHLANKTTTKQQKQAKQNLIPSQKQGDSPKKSIETTRTKVKIAVFKTILLEYSFYGMLVTGYLAWVSVCVAIRSSMDSMGLVAVGVIAVVWLVYTVLYVKVNDRPVQLKECFLQDLNVLLEQNSMVKKGFGDFRGVCQQIAKKQLSVTSPITKVYLVFIVERLLTSGLLIMVSPVFGYVSGIIIVIYTVLLVVLIVFYKKLRSTQNPKTTVFSHLYQNYTLRQSINFITTILIQGVFLYQQFSIRSSDNIKEVLSIKVSTTKLTPLLILSLISLNLVFNIFLWVWQLKQSQILLKSKLVVNIMCSKSSEPVNLPNPQEKDDNLFSSDVKSGEEKGDLSTTRKMMNQQEEMLEALNQCMGKSTFLNPRNSPFIGIKEKTSPKKKTIEVLKLNQQTNVLHTNIVEAVIPQNEMEEMFHQI